MFVLSADQIQQADSHAINEVGIPSIVLMENACRNSALIISREYPKDKFSNVLIIAGKGNNGGDGIGIARYLAELEYNVELVLLSTVNTLKKDPLINFNIYKNLGYKYSMVSNPTELSVLVKNIKQGKTIFVDAIFGTGLNKPVKNNFYKNIFKLINNSGLDIVSIDVPSGLSDKFIPEEGELIKADITISLQTLKHALIYPDNNNGGQIFITEIGIPAKSILHTKPLMKMIVLDDLRFIKIARSIDSHKGKFGHCLNISGSNDKPGASILSSIAILKSGAGLCTVAVSPQNRDTIINALPELMTKIYLEPGDLINSIEKSDVILSGPGLGINSKSKKTVELILQKASCPVILDADAINIVSETDLLKQNSNRIEIILSPHPGEFSKLTGRSKEDIKKNRIPLASEFAKNNGVFLILKGHFTIIASPDGSVYINQTGNPGMATAGSGDVLSGIITGFLAQFSDTIPIDEILAASVFIHGYAGDLAKEKKGELSIIASDIIEHLPEAITKIDDFKSEFKFA